MKEKLKQAIMYIIISVITTFGTIVVQNIVQRIQSLEKKVEFIIQNKTNVMSDLL